MNMPSELHIAIGADHRGFVLKQNILKATTIAGYKMVWHDCGADTAERSDYPVFAQKVSVLVRAGADNIELPVTRGILLCGTGTGMAIAANRYRGIYAAVAWNEDIARRAREEDWTNVLVLPADYLSIDESLACIAAWIKAEPKPGRYHDRILKTDCCV